MYFVFVISLKRALIATDIHNIALTDVGFELCPVMVLVYASIKDEAQTNQ